LYVRYFSERVSPAVNDVGAKKEGFGMWKEEWVRERQTARERSMAEENESSYNQLERHLEDSKEQHIVHKKTRGDMLVRLATYDSIFNP
jgi:hypothetical protein